MNAVIEDDCFVFVTDHFSLYTIIGFTPTEETLRGDFNNDRQVTSEDAIFLLWHTLFPQIYPISGSGDINHDGNVTDFDAVDLLWSVLFPDKWPL